MRNFALASLAALAVTACAAPSVVAQSGDRTVADELKAFPAATAGQKRHVLTLPAVQNEEDYQVQLLIGKIETVDCNTRSLGGNVETRTAEGWGYDYYVVPQIGPGVSTLMGCPPNSQRQDFVSISDRPLVRYNSRLPLVIYTPEDVQVRYRIWRAGEVRGLD